MNRWWIQENCHWCCSHVTPMKLHQIAVHHWPLLHTSQIGAFLGHQRHNPNYKWQNFYVFLGFYILLIHYHRKKGKYKKLCEVCWKFQSLKGEIKCRFQPEDNFFSFGVPLESCTGWRYLKSIDTHCIRIVNLKAHSAKSVPSLGFQSIIKH